MLNLQPKIFSHGLALPMCNNFSLLKMKTHKISSLQTKTKPCNATLASSLDLTENPRRSSGYHPTLWEHQLIELIHSPYDDSKFKERIEELKKEVKKLVKETEEPLAKLELIDSIRRLGLAYHFEEEIMDALSRFYVDGFEKICGLKGTSLCFRLLRENGYNASSDVFNKFKDEEGFKICLSQDVKGLLSLYEATHLSLPEEQILEEAREFSLKHLQCLSEDADLNLVEQVKYSLEAPLYWLMPRLEARHYIDVYEREEGKYFCLLELAKLDFNVVQALHQREVKDLSRWWKDLGLAQEFDFFRDRIFENYMWGVGNAFEPQFGKCRKIVAKLISVLEVIDDFYDVYSTLEEAQLFTDAIRRWDLEAMEELPHNLKLCYMALYNFVNETAYEILKDYGLDARHLLEREWICTCESYLKEAEWFHKKTTPTLEKYLENGWTSVGARILIYHALYHAGHGLTQQTLDHLKSSYQLIYLSSVVIRLIDDLAPSKAEMEKGVTSLAIHCRMKDSGESYETSKKFIEDLIMVYLKELNKETFDDDLPRIFIYVAMNTVRTCFNFCHHGDSLSTSSGITKDQITSLFIESIP